jgi:uncharacterized protein
MNQKVVNEIKEIIRREDILRHIQKMDAYYHHGKITTMWHCIAVTYFSLKIASLLKLKIQKKSMVIGALFHDYYLYDWHVREKYHQFHGFKRAKFALKNSKKIYPINPIEKDIILNHMFPLTFNPPRYKESILVSAVDKGCSISETLFKTTYHELKQAFDTLNLK